MATDISGSGRDADQGGSPEAARALQHQLDSALAAMSDALALFDAADRLLLHNPRFLEFFPFLQSLGDLRGRTFEALVNVPNGEWERVGDPSRYVAERLARHRAADGTPFDIPLENGGWARVYERRLPDGGLVCTWTDISELKATEAHLRDTISAIGEGFVLLGPDGAVQLCNQRFRDMLGLSPGTSTVGVPFGEVLREAAQAGLFRTRGAPPEVFAADLAADLGAADEVRVELSLRRRWALVSHRRMADGSTAGVWTDVTAQKRREAELVAARAQLERQADALADFARLLSRQARSDALTGLPNRFALEERLGQALHESPASLCLLHLDIDRFKVVNDAAGHAAGDEVLREVALTLRQQLRAGDLLARLGGDEFALVLADVGEEEALRVAARLNAAVHARTFQVEGHAFGLGLSIGVVAASPGLTTPARLLAAADTACYVAKDLGRDRIQLYDPGDRSVSSAEETLSWAERLQLAMENDRFRLHLQGIFGPDGIAGYEALIRLEDERGVLRGPHQFLPAARRLGFMGRIDEWVCRRALGYAARLAATEPNRYIAINLGVRTLVDPAFQNLLLALLDGEPEACGLLVVEITETDEIEDFAPLSAFLAQLRARGIRLFLDDFGSGYNSFDTLKRLGVDGIKIDWTVTADLLSDPIDEALVKAAASIAQSLDLVLVAEGVERPAELAKLRALGVTCFQGHHFHEPEDAEAALLR